MEENTQAEAPVVEEQESTAAQVQAEATDTSNVPQTPAVDPTQESGGTDEEPQEAPAVVIPAPTYDEVQAATKERIAGIPARITALVEIQGPAVLDMIEHHLLMLENVSK